MSVQYDAIVVGLGGAGSAALYHLASRGLKVLGLEKFGVAHEWGSSHGFTRIIRHTYFEDPSYVPLLASARTLWKELEVATGTKLLHEIGGLNMGGEVFDGSVMSARTHGLDHTILTGAQVNAKFPGCQVPDNMPAVYEPYAGFLESEKCIAAHIKGAIAAGADVRLNSPIASWASGRGPNDPVTVTTEGGDTFFAKSLVLSAGSWMPKLVPQLKNFCTVERQVVVWFEVSDPEPFKPEKHPVVILATPDGGHFYAFPEFGPQPGFKIGKMHHLKQAADPDALSRTVTPADVAVLREAVSEYFPKANGRVLHSSACMFTNTPDEHFLIDLHPCHPQVVMASACSGHGFKMMSVTGSILADLATKRKTAHDISLFAMTPDRLGARAALHLFTGPKSKM